MAATMPKVRVAWEVASDYDYSLATNVAYRAPAACPAASGAVDTPVAAPTSAYARSRADLDPAWHATYTPARETMQDSVVAEFLRFGCRPVDGRPWAVFSGGGMGCGKSFCIRDLHARSLFPLDTFCYIDADTIKTVLPESRGYIARNKATAGSLTHNESATIAEITMREAFRQSVNTLIDGSLRDYKWHADLFQRIRKHHPEYRIAVIMVTAPLELAVDRAARRAEVTGRVVPVEVIKAAFDVVPVAYSLLSALADFSCMLNNHTDGEMAAFVAPASVESFAATFADVSAQCVRPDPALAKRSQSFSWGLRRIPSTRSSSSSSSGVTATLHTSRSAAPTVAAVVATGGAGTATAAPVLPLASSSAALRTAGSFRLSGAEPVETARSDSSMTSTLEAITERPETPSTPAAEPGPTGASA